MAFYVFKWVSGEIIRTFETESDKMILDSRGDDSMTLTIPWDSLTATQKDSWRGDFQGISRGIAYTENTGSSEIVLTAGQISSTPELRNGLLNVSVRSMKEFLRSVVYDPGTAITDKTAKVQHDGTAAGYINVLLANVTSRAHLPSFGAAVGVGNGTASHHENILRDMTSIGDIIDELADDVYGTETRFDARKTGNRIEFYARYSTSGRLINTGLNTTIDLDSPNNRLISITPKTEWGDFQTTLWHEITVDNSENENLIDIRKTSISAMGEFPEIAVFENFNSALTPEERNVQVQARLDSNSKPFEKWEVEIFEEEERGNDLVKPITWITQDSCILGKKISITGGAAMEAESLQANLRCLAIQFSSQTSSVLIQLATERAIYPRLVKRVIDRTPSTPTVRRPNVGVPRLPSDFDGIGGGGSGPGPGPEPVVPDSPIPGWDWGSENYPDKGEFAPKNPVYGLQLGDIIQSYPWAYGNNLPAASDSVPMSWIWGQDDSGLGIYNAYFENFNPVQTVVGRLNDSYNSYIENWARGCQFFHNTSQGLNTSWLMDPPSGDEVNLVISSGKLVDGRIEDFNRRISIPMTKRFIEKMLYDNAPLGEERSLPGRLTSVHVYLVSIYVYDNKVLLSINLTLSNAGDSSFTERQHINRLVSIKKGETYDSILPDLITVSSSFAFWKAPAHKAFMSAGRRASNVFASFPYEQNEIDPRADEPFDTLEWKVANGNIKSNSYKVDKKLPFPAVKSVEVNSDDPRNRADLFRFALSYHTQGKERWAGWGAVGRNRMGKKALFCSVLSNEPYLNSYSQFQSISIPLKDTDFEPSTLAAWKNGVKNYKDEEAAYNAGPSPNSGVGMGSSITALTCPIEVSIGYLLNPRKQFIVIKYHNRMYSKWNDNSQDDFKPSDFGSTFPTGEILSGSYSVGVLIPNLSYVAKEFPNGVFTQSDDYRGEWQSPPHIVHYDGFIYFLPTGNMVSISQANNTNIPVPAVTAVEIIPITTPLKKIGSNEVAPRGDIPINGAVAEIPTTPITPPQT